MIKILVLALMLSFSCKAGEIRLWDYAHKKSMVVFIPSKFKSVKEWWNFHCERTYTNKASRELVFYVRRRLDSRKEICIWSLVK